MKIAHQICSGPSRHEIILALTLRHEKRTVSFTYQAPGGRCKIDLCINELSVGIDPGRDFVIAGFGRDSGHEVYMVQVEYDSRNRIGRIKLCMGECPHCGKPTPPVGEDTYCMYSCGKRIG